MSRKSDVILLSHGGGGRMSRDLISKLILKYFTNPQLQSMPDAAAISAPRGPLAFTTDSYVVRPLFFPGGDIGRLSVCGTVNDLAVVGAQPLALSCGLIIEEGFLLSDLERILESMCAALDETGAPVVTGDIKVVEKGAAQGLFINTSGIGEICENAPTGVETIVPGDRILVNGTLGDHGVAVLAQREGIRFDADVRSDCAPLNGLTRALLHAAPGVRFMRDPTRGGLASALNEICEGRAWGVELEQVAIPVLPPVAALCEILGLDPLHVANEGKIVAVVSDEHAEAALNAMKSHPLGKNAAMIGAVTADHPGRVTVRTPWGGARLLDMISGEQLPRIC